MVSASGSISLHGSSVQLLQPSAMAASENIVPKRLKIRISKVCSGSEAVSADTRRSSQISPPAIEDAKLNTSGNNFSDRVTEQPHSHDLKARFPLNRGSVMTSMSDKEKRMTSKSKLQKNTGDYADKETIVSERYNVQLSVPHPSKRGPVISLDTPKVKKQKIGSGVMQQCAALLKKLMTHPSGWVFNQPVDPVLLKIPDYFTIISEPMDLGTIKSKVDKKRYMNTEEFAADVRLTFSNAMIYNPPSNDVHIMAKELSTIFESGWKTLVAKWSTTCSMVGQQQKSNERLSKSLDLRGDGPKTQASCPKVSNKILLASVPRQKPRNDPIEIPESKMPPRLRDQSSESALFRCSSGLSSSQKDLHKGNGNGNRPVYGSVSDMSRTSSYINGSCESMNSRSSHQNAIPSDADSEQSSGRVNDKKCHNRVHNKDIAASGAACRQTVKLRPDSDGGVSAVDEEKVAPSSHPPALGTNTSSSSSASEEGWETNVYGQLSPSKALRAAMLRSRFADTIVKAQEKTLLNNGERSDPLKLKQEKERLEKQQREEKARIEAEIRAAKAASRAREEMELREKREREREAARIALEKMERTVEIYENMDILGDLEKLGAYPGYISLYSESPLARLGLYIRDAYLEEDELENCNWDINLSDVVEEEHDIHLVDDNGGLENCNRDADVEEGEIAC